MNKRQKSINFCFICGKEHPDTKEHIPPKGLLPRGTYNGINLITLPTHLKCNNDFSIDEQYYINLVIPESTIFNNMSDGRIVFDKVKKSWERPQGMKLRKRILNNSEVIELKSPDNMVMGNAIGIHPELERIERVVWKIARGIVTYDTKLFITDDYEHSIIPFRTYELYNEAFNKNNEQSDAGKRFWQCFFVNAEPSWHYQPTEHIAIRRIYECEALEPKIEIAVKMIIAIYMSSYVVYFKLLFEKNDFPSFPFFIVDINNKIMFCKE